VTKEQRNLEKKDNAIKAKVDCRHNKKKKKSPNREQIIKAATLFQTAEEEKAVK